jgi:hypothetical protein
MGVREINAETEKEKERNEQTRKKREGETDI